VVVGCLAAVPLWDRFLSPIPDGRGNYEGGLRSMLVYQLEFFSLNVLLIWVPGHNSVPGKHFIYFATMMAGYSILGFYPMKVMHSFKFIRT